MVINMTLAPNHRQDLEKSGLSEETITAAGIKSVSPGSINKKLGFNYPGLESCYEIPYHGCEGFSRFRIFYTDGKQGAKYLQRKGSLNHLYIPPASRAYLSDIVVPVYLVEGEKKALKGVQEGLSCIGLPGLWNWTKGKGELIQDFELLYLQGRQVYIVPDNDWKTPKVHGYKGKGSNLEEAVRRLSEKLIERGASVSIVQLPVGPPKGLDDYLCQHSIEDFKALPVINLPFSTPEILELLETWDYIRGCEIKIEWVVDRLIPKGAIIVFFGKGGIGKTWVSMDLARCIGDGLPYLGLQTIQSPVVFIDFENPLAVLNERTRKLGECQNVYFWRANNPKLTAPRLDSKEWDLYKKLPTGAVLIFDTLRASQGRDENASNEMGLIMGRLKELRDMGFTVILLHHTAKNNDRVAKGSTAIVDLADHILGITLVRKKKDGSEEILDDDDDEEGAVYRFGVREKTRFEPYHFYLTLDPERGFNLAPDPEEELLEAMFKLLEQQGELNKTSFMNLCKGDLSLGERKFGSLFQKGQGRLWTAERQRANNAVLVKPNRFRRSDTPYSTSERQNQNLAQTDVQPQNDNEYLEIKGFRRSEEDMCRTSKPDTIIPVFEEVVST